MYCKKCGKEIKQEDLFCTNCGTAVQNDTELKKKDRVKDEKLKIEKKKIMNDEQTDIYNKKLLGKIALISVNVIAIVLVIVMLVLYFKKKETIENNQNMSTQEQLNENISKTEQSQNDNTQEQNNNNDNSNNSNFEKTGTNVYLGDISFENMSSDDDNYNDTQKEIIKYFDNGYFLFNIESSKRYPQVFKGAKVYGGAVVKKILKSTDKEFEALAIFEYEDFGAGPEEILKTDDKSKYLVIKGKQLDERLLEGDIFIWYGRYDNVNSYNIDGKSYTLPTINAMNIYNPNKDRYSYSTIKTVAEYIFGKDIKISEPQYEVDYNENTMTDLEANRNFLLVKLDNQSNANFKAFNFFQTMGIITYNSLHNQLSYNTAKRLFISADFKHFIVSTYDYSLKHLYIEYFDNSFKKLWSREYDFKSNNEEYVAPMDYTKNYLSFVIDTDLHLLDINTGKDIVEPILVGNKEKVSMVSDGIVLIGTDNKDTIVKVGYDGKIIYRIDGDTKIKIDQVDSQIVNGKMVVELWGVADDDSGRYFKYLVLENNGKVNVSSNDIFIEY